MLSGSERLASRYAVGLRRFWWLAPLTAIVAGATGLVSANRQTPTYSATATAALKPSDAVQGTSDVLRSLETLERRTVIATFARIASTRETRLEAERLLGLEAGDLSRYSVNASVISSTNLLRVRVEGPDPELTASLADGALVVTQQSAHDLYRLFDIEGVEAASVPRRPIHPDPVRSVGVAGVIGLLLGALAASLSGALPGPVARHARNRGTADAGSSGVDQSAGLESTELPARWSEAGAGG